MKTHVGWVGVVASRIDVEAPNASRELVNCSVGARRMLVIIHSRLAVIPHIVNVAFRVKFSV